MNVEDRAPSGETRAEAAPAPAAPHNPNEGWGPLSGLPGNPIMWLLIASELLVFGAAFVGYAGARIMDPQTFVESQDHLNRLAGALNTMVLLTSGYFAARAVAAIEAGDSRMNRLWLLAAGSLGVVFLIVKFFEYAEKAEAGIGMETNTFFTLYYLITGFHALHVVFGLVILAIIAKWNSLENIETGTAFWHMVDLIWVIVFPVIYVMR
ncbi:MAG: copper oxidase [Hyphomicrobiales bacterium]|nr:MAG: copper oxidase [Hyphomicrobiales bacterium]